MAVDYTVIVVYLAGMLAMGWWGMRRAKSKSDFLVAGRRLGPVMYSGTMAAIVLGGASTIGGVGLGYKYGLSGAWMVFTIGLGLLALSVFFSARIARLKVYTVSEMLDLRYGGRAGVISGIVMWAYTLMLAVTSTIAYATIFDVLFDMNRTLAIVLGGSIVVAYSTLGGMWSITLTDMVQFVVKTIGVLLLLLPIAVVKAGGFGEMKAKLPTEYFDPLGIGGETIFTYVLIYTFGMLIGQDQPYLPKRGCSRPAATGRPSGAARSPVPTVSSTPSRAPSSARRPRSCTRTSAARTTPSRPSSRTNSRSAYGGWCWPPPWPP